MMRTKLTIFAVVAAAAASAALVMNGCGGSSCGPGNCAGCCDANNLCQVAAADHCGKNGLACSVCGTGQSCFLGACQFGGGNGSGNGSGNGTTSSGTTVGSTGTNTGSTTNGTTTNGTTTTGSTGNTGTSTGTTTTGTTTTGTTTTGTSTTGTSTTGTSTTGTTGTTGATFCAAPPTDTNPPIDNGGIGTTCTPNNTTLPDGGSVPTQGSCGAGQICTKLYGPTSNPVCTAQCSATAPCPGNTTTTQGSYCYQPGGAATGICIAVGHSDNASCPSGLFGQPSAHPSDLTLCVAACSGASDCNRAGGTTQNTCNSGKCQCTRDADCNGGTVTGNRCDTASGACYQPCASTASCPTGGCCLQYGGKAFCDFSTQ